MKKYFTFDNEQISGGTMWLRLLLQGPLVYLFGLGIYLQTVTIYKRSRQFYDINKAIWSTVITCLGQIIGAILILIGQLAIEEGASLEDSGLYLIIGIACFIPYFKLWFENAPKKDNTGS